jgi:hypothetical protein
LTVTRAILLVLVLEAVLAILAVYFYDFTIEGLQAVTRYSGRLSLGLFSIIFIFLPQHEERVFDLLSSKPFLVFALAHGIHLAELLSYVSVSGNELIPVRAAGGFLAYVIIFAMPLIRHRFQNGTIPHKQYRIALTIYLYYIWFIFFMSYLPRVQGKLTNIGGSYWEFVVLLCWVCMLLGMKLPALIFNQKRS